jgi:hypothetical protein
MKQALLDKHAPEGEIPSFGHSAKHSVSSYGQSTAIAKSPPAISIRQHLLSETYETGAVGISKETEPVLCIKYTISEDMTKGEQARNKARLSAIVDRPRILGSKRSSVLGFAHGRTAVMSMDWIYFWIG